MAVPNLRLLFVSLMLETQLGAGELQPEVDKSRQTLGKPGVFSFLHRLLLSQEGTNLDRSSRLRGLTLGYQV